jgi:hypothetical protein
MSKGKLHMKFLFKKEQVIKWWQFYFAFEYVLENLRRLSLKSDIFWDITPCSPLKVNRRFWGTYRLHLQGRRIIRARNQHETDVQAEAICSSETSVDFQRTIWHYIPEDSTLHNRTSSFRFVFVHSVEVYILSFSFYQRLISYKSKQQSPTIKRPWSSFGVNFIAMLFIV